MDGIPGDESFFLMVDFLSCCESPFCGLTARSCSDGSAGRQMHGKKLMALMIPLAFPYHACDLNCFFLLLLSLVR